MYQPQHFKEDRLEVLHALIKAYPFGLLISSSADGLEANGVPFILDAVSAPFGVLSCHVARANRQWKNLDGQNVLAVFQGPQTYISPSLYETKRETGKVVPTWNYVMVQVKGVASVHEDHAWLSTQIRALTQTHEAGRSAPWAVDDAPEGYIESQMNGIVGIEIPISSIEGKWKMSQNRPEADRQGVAEGLTDQEVAKLVRER
ncbi:MAG TPA: FMN-binding negative transcriptional regulator [Aestuariivirga sp.]